MAVALLSYVLIRFRNHLDEDINWQTQGLLNLRHTAFIVGHTCLNHYL